MAATAYVTREEAEYPLWIGQFADGTPRTYRREGSAPNHYRTTLMGVLGLVEDGEEDLELCLVVVDFCPVDRFPHGTPKGYKKR